VKENERLTKERDALVRESQRPKTPPNGHAFYPVLSVFVSMLCFGSCVVVVIIIHTVCHIMVLYLGPVP
jgi:hypothetical protein